MVVDDFSLLLSKGYTGNDRWYPLGCGNMLPALVNSGKFEKLLSQNDEYVFVANSDKLGCCG